MKHTTIILSLQNYLIFFSNKTAKNFKNKHFDYTHTKKKKITQAQQCNFSRSEALVTSNNCNKFFVRYGVLT